MRPDRPPGLPYRALTLGSDRAAAACTRRWWFSRAEGLRPRTEARALGYGTAWHAAMEDVHRWWMETGGHPYPDALDESRLGLVCVWCAGDSAPGAGGRPCSHCDSTGQGPIGRAMFAWVNTDRHDDVLTLSRALRGWFEVYGAVPSNGWKVLAVEAAMALPVPSPDSKRGETYAPELCWIVAPDGRARLARTGEGRPDAVLPPGHRAEWERTPAWISVRVDALWLTDRGGVYVHEHKSSGDPRRYASLVSYDPQVTIYELALEHALKAGRFLGRPAIHEPGSGALLTHGSGYTVAGWVYDVASSHMQRDPRVLKSGALSSSRSTLANVPAWRLRSALAARGIDPYSLAAPPKKAKARSTADEDDEGSDPRTWADVVMGQGEVETKLYVREFGLSGPEERARAMRETYAAARRSAALHRAAAMAAPGSPEIDIAFPRVPICRQPGSFCPYRGPCLADGPHAREAYTVRDFAPVVSEPEPEVEPDEPAATDTGDWGF